MANNEKIVTVGKRSVGFFGIVFIILLVLKSGVVPSAATGWSWWFITLPLWWPLGLVAIVCLIVLAIVVVVCIVMLTIYIVQKIISLYHRIARRLRRN